MSANVEPPAYRGWNRKIRKNNIPIRAITHQMISNQLGSFMLAPNVEQTNAAQLYRVATSGRKEQG
jgi:hypothetical protein